MPSFLKRCSEDTSLSFLGVFSNCPTPEFFGGDSLWGEGFLMLPQINGKAVFLINKGTDYTVKEIMWQELVENESMLM